MARIVRTVLALLVLVVVALLMGWADPYRVLVGGGAALAAAAAATTASARRARSTPIDGMPGRIPLLQAAARVTLASLLLFGVAAGATEALRSTVVHGLFADSDRVDVDAQIARHVRQGEYRQAAGVARERLAAPLGTSRAWRRELAEKLRDALSENARRSAPPEAIPLLEEAVTVADNHGADAQGPRLLLEAVRNEAAFIAHADAARAAGDWAGLTAMLAGRIAACDDPEYQRQVAALLYNAHVDRAASLPPATPDAREQLAAAVEIATRFALDGRVAQTMLRECDAHASRHDDFRQRVSDLRAAQRWADLAALTRLELERMPVAEAPSWLTAELISSLIALGRDAAEPGTRRAHFEEARETAARYGLDTSPALLELERLDRPATPAPSIAAYNDPVPRVLPEGTTGRILRVNAADWPILIVDTAIDPPSSAIGDDWSLGPPDFTARVCSADVTVSTVAAVRSKDEDGGCTVVLALDTSGSMSSHISALREGALSFLAIAQARGARVGVRVITFNSGVTEATGSQWVSPDQAAAALRTSSLLPGGGTALYAAIRDAVDLAAQRAETASSRRHVVAFTDGRDTDGSPALLEEVLASARARGVTVSCIGLVSDDLDWPCLQRIARETSGTAARGDAEHLATLFQNTAAVVGRLTFRVAINAGQATPCLDDPRFQLTVGSGPFALTLHADPALIATWPAPSERK